MHGQTYIRFFKFLSDLHGRYPFKQRYMSLHLSTYHFAINLQVYILYLLLQPTGRRQNEGCVNGWTGIDREEEVVKVNDRWRDMTA